MNLWGFTPSFVAEGVAAFPKFLDKILAANPMKGEFYLPSLVSQLLADGKARTKVLSSHSKWYGVTYQADKPTVMAALAAMTEEGIYPSPLWQS